MYTNVMPKDIYRHTCISKPSNRYIWFPCLAIFMELCRNAALPIVSNRQRKSSTYQTVGSSCTWKTRSYFPSWKFSPMDERQKWSKISL